MYKDSSSSYSYPNLFFHLLFVALSVSAYPESIQFLWRSFAAPLAVFSKICDDDSDTVSFFCFVVFMRTQVLEAYKVERTCEWLKDTGRKCCHRTSKSGCTLLICGQLLTSDGGRSRCSLQSTEQGSKHPLLNLQATWGVRGEYAYRLKLVLTKLICQENR